MITSKDKKEAEDFCNASEEYLSLSESAKQEAFIELRQLQNRVREAVKVLEESMSKSYCSGFTPKWRVLDALNILKGQ